MYKLFLDDLRAPPDGSWVVARSVAAAKVYVTEYGPPNEMSLDHDLGGEDTPVFLHWLINQHLDGVLNAAAIRTIGVHSANPVGRENMLGLWTSFMFSQEV